MAMAAVDAGIMGLEDFTAALEWQARHAEENGAPATGRVIRALAGVRASDTATGRRIAGCRRWACCTATVPAGSWNLLLRCILRRPPARCVHGCCSAKIKGKLRFRKRNDRI